MFSSLELPFRSYSNEAGELAALRPLFYGFVSPATFLCDSVDTFLAEMETRGSFKGGSLADSKSDPESFLVEARQAIQSEGMTPNAVASLKTGLRNALDRVVNPRERLQLWACLRSLGQPPVADVDPNPLLGVVFEFWRGTTPCLVAVYSDGSALSVGTRLMRWSATEEGDARGWIQSIVADGALLGSKVPASSDGMPMSPQQGEVTISFLYPSGPRCSRFQEETSLTSQYGELFASSFALWDLLDSDAPIEFSGWDLDAPEAPYSSVGRRFVASLLDFVFSAAFLAVVGFFTRNTLSTWSFSALVSLGAVSSLLPPLLAAWMESSPHWGFRTFGKQVMGCRVLSVATGDGPTFLQALARNFAKWFISSAFLFCGFLWAGFHRYNRSWHDALADTVVTDWSDAGEPELEETSILAAPGKFPGVK